jgi:glycine/D-amino acid oxidase-like deaminating enzyme
MKNSYDAIVVGAGISGCCLAWQLRQRGLQVAVFEAGSRPGCEATQAAAGFVAQWSAVHVSTWGAVHQQMQRYGIDFYTELANQPGADIGFKDCGAVYVYPDAEIWKEVQPRIITAGKLGIELEILDAQRAREVVPEIVFDEVAGIIYDASAIRICAATLGQYLAATLATDVDFIYDKPVRSVQDAPLGVVIDGGTVLSDYLFIAAGAWTRPLLQPAGLDLPVVPKSETRFTTAPLAGVRAAMPLILVQGWPPHYIRAENGGLLIGGSELDIPADRYSDVNNPPTSANIPDGQAYRLRESIRSLEPVMPLLADADIESTASGLPTFTDDMMFVADEVPGRRGIYCLTACQEAGVTHGPALARHLTELAIDDTSRWNQALFGISRFFQK